MLTGATRRYWRHLGVLVTMTAVASCGADDVYGNAADPSAASPESEPCAVALSSSRYADEGDVGGGLDTGSVSLCYVEFEAGDEALANLGVETSCPMGASIVVVFDLKDDRLVFNEAETTAIDNAPCTP